ncbi:MAG: hypothetical protein FJY21_06965 [Bacteroidetes bacterium]|nr:hypothetical protein [Bacteroidota bacterium]
MRFLSPGFLFALLTIAIPVIIHLFNFRKFKKVYFSNVRFLKNVQIQTSSRQHLKHRLILASRILGICFLVFAFSRPFIPAAQQQNLFQEEVLSIYIDNSYSMEALNKEGTLLDEAKRRAKEISSAYSLNDKFQLISNDFDGKDQRLLSLEEFQTAVNELNISSSSRNLDQIISRQKDVFLKEPNSGKTIYLISDFQENILPERSISADSTIKTRLIRLSSNTQPNISMDSVWFGSRMHKPGESEKLIIRLRNNSDEEALSVPIKLTINKIQKSISSLTIKARSIGIDTLTFSGLLPGWQDAELEITDFPVVFDNKFYFSFHVQQSIPVLVINGRPENEYLNSVYRSDSFFKLSNIGAGNINYSALSNYPLIILNELNTISDGLIQQLNNYILLGGSLMVFPNLSESTSDLANLLSVLNADLPLEVLTADNKVSKINLDHPIFQGVFDNIPKQIDLPVTKKYVRYSSRNNKNRENILEMPGNIPFLSEYKIGSGKLYLSAIPLSAETSNFVRHSIFVPIMYQTALLSRSNQNLFYKLNKDQLIELPKISLGSNQILKLTKDAFETIPDLRQNDNVSLLYIADQIKQAGNYELLKNDSLLTVLSFNEQDSESDLSYANDEKIRESFPDQAIELMNPKSGSLTNEVKAINQGTSLWKFCLILALIFFAAEILIIRSSKKITIKPINY